MKLETYPFYSETKAGSSAGAVLDMLATYFGVRLSSQALDQALHPPDESHTLLSLTEALKANDFHVKECHCDYAGLLESAVPAIAQVDIDSTGPNFALIYKVSADAVTLALPSAGVFDLSREDFCREWSGHCAMIEGPQNSRVWNPDQSAPHEEVSESKMPRFLGFVGLALGLSLLLYAEFTQKALPFDDVRDTHDSIFPLLASLGLGILSSYWSAAFSSSCSSCSKAAALVGGLPLAMAGCVVFALLFATAYFSPHSDVVAFFLFTALGVQGLLFALLVRRSIRCLPCIATFVAVALAAIVYAQHFVANVLPCLVLSGVTAVVADRVFAYARIARRRGQGNRLLALSQEILRQGTCVPLGQARLIVFKRERCPRCIHYSTMIQPRLVERFGDALSIEIRDAGEAGVVAPSFLVHGGVPSVIASSDHDSYEILSREIQIAQERVISSLLDLEAQRFLEQRL